MHTKPSQSSHATPNSALSSPHVRIIHNTHPATPISSCLLLPPLCVFLPPTFCIFSPIISLFSFLSLLIFFVIFVLCPVSLPFFLYISYYLVSCSLNFSWCFHILFSQSRSIFLSFFLLRLPFLTPLFVLLNPVFLCLSSCHLYPYLSSSTLI